MKPRTKLQKTVSELSNKLSEITNAHKRWATEHLFAHEAYKCKNELWCSDCGGVWIDTNNSELGAIILGDSIECPYCHHKLKVKVSRKKKSTDEVYMSILQVVGGFQVIRHVLCCKCAYKKRPTLPFPLIFVTLFLKPFKNGSQRMESVPSWQSR